MYERKREKWENLDRKKYKIAHKIVTCVRQCYCPFSFYLKGKKK